MPVHIGLRLTQALDRCRAQPYSIQIDTRLSFLHIRSQLRSLTVGDQAYSKCDVPEKNAPKEIQYWAVRKNLAVKLTISTRPARQVVK